MAESDLERLHPGNMRDHWYCGTMKTVPQMVGRIVSWHWVPVNGCGWLNRPSAEKCTHCGKDRPEWDYGTDPSELNGDSL